MSEIKFNLYNDSDQHAKGFKEINARWIEHYFGLEDIDLKYLDNPKSEILNKGGFIYIAESGNDVVGTCAMIKMDNPEFDFELAKMGVDDQFRGLGIGRKLAELCIQHAKEIGAKKIYLESNSKLKAALGLYSSLGFIPTEDYQSPYCRCDVQLQLSIS